MNAREILNSFALMIQNKSEDSPEELFTKSSCDHLDVYKNNFLVGHIKHLKSVYPICEQILGENNFKFFMSQFITISPPISENMNEYGNSLDQFFESREELSDIFYITYLAKLEWAIFDQGSSEIELPRGVYRLWECLSNNQDPSEIEIDEEEIEKIKFE